MARLSRRGFIAASGALAAAPALTAITAQAQGRGAAPDTGNLRVEKDIVFGKGGTMDLTLDVYQPPAGVTPKRMAIIHLFGGGFFTGNKNAGYIINDAKALGARGYTNISANYRLQTQGSWPAQIHDVKAAVRWTRANATRLDIDPNRIVVAGYSAGGMLSLMAAGTNGRKEFEGEGGNAGVSSDVNASSASIRWRARRQRAACSRRVRRRPRTSPRHRRRPTSATTFAPTIFIHGTKDGTIPVASSVDFFTKLHALGVPSTLTLIQGADHAFDNNAPDAVEVMAASIDLFLDRLMINPRPYPSFGGGGGGRGGRGGGRGAAPGGAAPGGGAAAPGGRGQ